MTRFYQVDCSNCNATGEVTVKCGHCSGTGKIAGKLKCPHCVEGELKCKCPVCKGKKYTEELA
jgi:RecJ-like exonuclease